MFQAALYDIHCSNNKQYWALCNKSIITIPCTILKGKTASFLNQDP